jgi:uncharacterized protein (DUF2249 family)
MKKPPPLELDVRPMLERKRPPLPAILDAVTRLADGQSLKLIAPFEPAPLYSMLAERGFTHRATQIKPGVWEIVFSPAAAK